MRHAEGEHNRAKRRSAYSNEWTKIRDPALTKEGVAQCREMLCSWRRPNQQLRRAIQGDSVGRPELVVVSPMLRTLRVQAAVPQEFSDMDSTRMYGQLDT